MDELLENSKKAVEKYHSKQAGDKIKATKAVLSSVLACRKYIEENEQEDRGIAQRFARELSEILSPIPMFRKFATDKKALHNIHNKKMAEEHLDAIQKDLEGSVKDLELSKKRKIHEWVKTHPVLGKLRRSASKKLPQGAYVLLFRGSKQFARHKKVDFASPEKPKELAPAEQSTTAKFEEGNIQATGIDQTVETTAVEATAIEATAIEATAVEATAVEATAVEAAVVKATAVEATAVEATPTAVDQTALPAAAIEAEVGVVDGALATKLTDTPAQEMQIESSEQKSIPMELKPADESSSVTTSSAEKPDFVAAGPAESPVLVVRPAPEGKVFTRFRPKEFSDDLKIYRMFRGGPPLVGACIIAEGKLLSAIGTLPQPAEGGDQLRHLVTLSKEAVGKPGRDFVESNFVLNELFQLFKTRSIHKDAYVLLFQHSGEFEDEEDHDEFDNLADEPETEDNLETAHSVGQDGSDISVEQEGSIESAELTESLEGIEESAVEEELASTTDEENPIDDILDEHGEDGGSSESNLELGDQALESTEAPENKEASGNAVTEVPSNPEDEWRKFELVSKRMEDGRVITRFRNFDFNDSRTLYEGFKKRKPIVGAAIIKDKELIKIIGSVPQAPPGKKQIDVLLRFSNQALEKPSLEFIAANDVLNNLHQIATSDFKDKDCSVVLFAETEGRPTVMHLPDRRGKKYPKMPLFEFKNPKLLHDKFKNEATVVGASVISQQTTAPPAQREPAGKSAHGRDKGDRGAKPDFGRSRTATSRPPVVMAAFGKTPLKQNVLLSAEILKRLGVDPSIL